MSEEKKSENTKAVIGSEEKNSEPTTNEAVKAVTGSEKNKSEPTTNEAVKAVIGFLETNQKGIAGLQKMGADTTKILNKVNKKSSLKAIETKLEQQKQLMDKLISNTNPEKVKKNLEQLKGININSTLSGKLSSQVQQQLSKFDEVLQQVAKQNQVVYETTLAHKQLAIKEFADRKEQDEKEKAERKQQEEKEKAERKQQKEKEKTELKQQEQKEKAERKQQKDKEKADRKQQKEKEKAKRKQQKAIEKQKRDAELLNYANYFRDNTILIQQFLDQHDSKIVNIASQLYERQEMLNNQIQQIHHTCLANLQKTAESTNTVVAATNMLNEKINVTNNHIAAQFEGLYNKLNLPTPEIQNAVEKITNVENLYTELVKKLQQQPEAVELVDCDFSKYSKTKTKK